MSNAPIKNVQTDHSMRQNLQNDQTKSHVTKPTTPNQIPSTKNAQMNRAQGNGSGSNHHFSGASNMVKSTVFL